MKLVYDTVKVAFADITDRVYQAGAVGVDDIPPNPELPFVLISEITTVPHLEVQGISDAERIPYNVYFYGPRGSGSWLGQVLRRLRTPVLGLTGQTSPTGARCLGVSWGGLSQDFPAEEYEATARYVSFTLTGSHHKEA